MSGGLHRLWKAGLVATLWSVVVNRPDLSQRNYLLAEDYGKIVLESVDVVLLFVNQRGVEKLLQDQFSLGGDASISAGPIGRTAEAGTDILLGSEIYSYARSRGLFAGVSLDGARMYQDGDVNKDLYGREIKPQDILITPKVGMPAGAAHLIGVLNKYSPRAPYVKK